MRAGWRCRVIAAHQEHGILAIRPGSMAELPQLPVGAQLRMLPNHACATAAQHTTYHVIDGNGGDQKWERMAGW